MMLKVQLIGFYTIIRREIVRMLRIFTQVFLPPVITTLLYFLIFGTIIGQRIGPIYGVSYSQFIAPGLVMMSVITNSYSNVSTSFFNVRFQRNIEEMLISPLHYSVLLCGFIVGGMLRGILVSILVFAVSYCFVDIHWQALPGTLGVVILVSALFSLAGFTNGILARNFDDIAIVPTFILGPLTYLGGVFYTTDMLSPFWKTITFFNPILYMVDALRYVMIAEKEVHIYFAMSIIIILLLGLLGLNIVLLKKGIGIRD